jgi:hypothetical protein
VRTKATISYEKQDTTLMEQGEQRMDIDAK